MKRILSTLLIVALLVGILPPMNVYAVTISDDEWKGFNSTDPKYQLTQAEKDALIQLKIMGTALNNKSRLKSGEKVLYVAVKPLTDPKQPMVVYNYADNYAHMNSRGFGGYYSENNTYKYLGYTIEGRPVTNDLYANYNAGYRTPSALLNYQYRRIEDATKNSENAGLSWKNVNEPTTNHILKTKVESEDETNNVLPNDFTLMKILGKSLNYSSNTNDYKPYTLIQSKPTFKTDGNIKTYYKGWSDKLGAYINSYNTFTVSAMGKEFKPPITTKIYSDSACTQQISEISLLPTEPQKTVYAKVSVNLDMTSIGFQNKESEIVQSVQNSLTGGSKSNPISSITNTNKYDVKNVYPIVLKWKDYTPEFKKNEYTGNSVVMYKSDMLDRNELSAKATLNVRSLKPSDIVAEFSIKYNGEIKTDQSVLHDKPQLDKDFNFTLNDLTYVPNNNEIKTWNWFALNYKTNKYEDGYFGFTKDTVYPFSPITKQDYIKDNKITIKLLVTDKYGKQDEKIHTVSLLTTADKPDPVKPEESVPKAFVYPPSGLRAGTPCGITGEGTSSVGISDYEFDLASSFKVTSQSTKSVEGSFLSFDTSVNDDWSESTTLTVTDTAGKTATDTGKTLVKHPITPVFKTHGVYKVHRTITLDGSESTGTHYYPLDKISWVIRPMDGQSISVVKPHVASKVNGNSMTIEGASPKVDFKQLGRYEVWMDVHATCTFSGETHRTASKQVYGIIDIQPDEPPVAKLTVPSKTIRSLEDGQKATITVWDESYSPDGDGIGKRKFYVRRDTNNDKSTADEAWELIYEGTADRTDYKAVSVGFYEFRVEVEETNTSGSSPFWNPVTDVLKANSDAQPLIEKQAEVINVAPIVSYLAERKKLDLVLVTDYEGVDYTVLKTQLDMLTKDLFEKGVDIQIKVFKDKIKNGSVNAPVYNYVRYLRYSYTYDGNVGTNIRTNYTEHHKIAWETKKELETGYIPRVINNPIEYVTSSYNDFNGEWGDRGIKLIVNAPYDPYLLNGIVKIRQYARNPEVVEEYNNIRNIKISMDETYTKETIDSYVDQDLICLNLDKLRTEVKYRDGSDRQMLFVLKTGDSVNQLNQLFADYVKQNGVTVSAISGFDMASQAGGLVIDDAEWLRKSGPEIGPETILDKDENGRWNTINNYQNSILKGLALKTENGKTMALLNSRAFGNWSLQYMPTLEFPVNLDGYTFKYPKGLVDTQYIQITDTKRDFYETQTYRLEKAAEGNSGGFSIDYAARPETNSLKALVATKQVQEEYESRGQIRFRWTTVPDYGERTLVKHMAGILWGDGYFYFVKNGTLYQMPSSRVDEPWQNATVVSTGIKEVVTEDEGGKKNSAELLNAFPKSGDDKYFIDLFRTYDCRNQLVIYYPQLNKTRYMRLTSYRVFKSKDGYGSIQYDYYNKNIDYWLEGKPELINPNEIKTNMGYYTIYNNVDSEYNGNINLRTTDAKAFVGGFRRPPILDGFEWSGSSNRPIYRRGITTDGVWYLDKNNDIKCYYNGVIYSITQGMNIKKYLVINDMQWRKVYSTGGADGYSVVFLTNDGKLLKPKSLNGNFTYGITNNTPPITPEQCENIVKDPRILATPVVNALSMRKLLNQSSANKIKGSFEDFANGLRSEYDYLKYQTKTTLLLGEELKYSTIYYDYEGDPMLSSAVSIAHDPNALESPIGVDLNNGKTIADWDRRLNKTGLYTLNPKVQDNPSGDERFADYRLWNKDNMTLEVLVHRKPIASMKVSVSNVAPYTLSAKDSNSRDLDHLTMATPLRGITEVEWGFKKLYADDWQIYRGGLGTPLTSLPMETGETYIVSYRVKDVEGQWSDTVTEQVVAGMNLLLDAKLQPENPAHSLSKFQTGNNVVFADIWTSYPLAHHIDIQMYDGANPILNKLTIRKEWGNVRAENYPERDWNNVLFNIPKSLADKTYSFVVTAYDSSNATIRKSKSFNITTVSNTAPLIDIVSHTPTDSYVCDNVSVKINLTDADLQTLNMNVKTYNVANNLISNKDVVVNPNGSSYPQQTIEVVQNADVMTYRVVATVNDGFITARDEYTFSVKPMTLSGSLSPSPTKAGYYVTVTGNTDGYAQAVTATITKGKMNGKVLTMQPTAALQKSNTWTVKFKTDAYEPDGTIPIILTATKNGRTITTTLNLVIKGSVLERKATTK